MEPNLGLPDDLSFPEPWQRTLSLPGDPALPGLETLREYGLAETLPELHLGDLAVALRMFESSSRLHADRGACCTTPARRPSASARPTPPSGPPRRPSRERCSGARRLNADRGWCTERSIPATSWTLATVPGSLTGSSSVKAPSNWTPGPSWRPSRALDCGTIPSRRKPRRRRRRFCRRLELSLTSERWIGTGPLGCSM